MQGFILRCGWGVLRGEVACQSGTSPIPTHSRWQWNAETSQTKEGKTMSDDLPTNENETIILELMRLPCDKLSPEELRMLDAWFEPRYRAIRNSYLAEPFQSHKRREILGWAPFRRGRKT